MFLLITLGYLFWTLVHSWHNLKGEEEFCLIIHYKDGECYLGQTRRTFPLSFQLQEVNSILKKSRFNYYLKKLAVKFQVF